MDYYQKYQKYKFKYLNLLSLTIHQSGGYTPEEFKQILQNKKDEDFLEDINFLTLDKIKVKDAVLINTRVYDVNSIFEWIKIKYNENKNRIAKDPLTNNELELQHLIDIKNKLFDEEKIKYFYDLYKKEVAYIQQRILKLDSKYRKKLLKFDNHEKIKYIIKNLIDNKIKELFDNSNLNNLYSLNLYALMDYLDKYIKKSSRIKKSCFVKKSSKNQAKKSSQKNKNYFL